MLNSIRILLRFFCFWLVFFLIDRAIFMIYFHDKLGASTGEAAAAFIHGIRLDASTAVYLSAIPLLGYIFLWFFPRLKVPVLIPRIYVYFIIVILSIVSVVNLNLYREWGSKLNFKVFEIAFNTPGEAIASASSSPLLLSLFIVLAMTLTVIWLSGKIIEFKMPRTHVPVWLKAVSSALFIVIAVLIIRGGWQLAPVNQSMAYYSSKPILNHAAVNTHWNLLHDWLKQRSIAKNPYQYLDRDRAKQLVHELHNENDNDKTSILTTKRPNIVLVLLESFTADLVESLGGEPGITPGIEKLADSGILFTNIYASGDRTDKGLVAVLSGFPAQAIRSIVKENNKHEKLPSLAADLKKNGYHTSFFYGGESEFANIKSYILSHGYEKLVDQNAFEEPDKNSKWGTHDHVVFNRQLAELSGYQQPFFSTILTLSNHEPFELPVRHHFPGKSIEDKFRSTAFYTDSVLFDFVQRAKKESWYKNTLFIVVADHGHRLPLNKYESYEPGRYRIPLLFFGNVIKEEHRGKKIDITGSQTDIATTLLNQLDIPSDDYNWGNNLFAPHREFAFFNWDNGFGIVTAGQTITYDNVGKSVIYKRENDYAKNDSILTLGKAYMQRVFQQYLDY